MKSPKKKSAGNPLTPVKSITNKVLSGGKNVDKTYIGKTLGNIGGIAYSYFEVQTKYGASRGLKGDFVAQNPETGDLYSSEAIFLPSNATDLVVGQLKEGSTEVVINLTVKVAESDKNDKGIAYICDAPETEVRKNRRALMLEQFAENFNVPQLTD